MTAVSEVAVTPWIRWSWSRMSEGCLTTRSDWLKGESADVSSVELINIKPHREVSEAAKL